MSYLRCCLTFSLCCAIVPAQVPDKPAPDRSKGQWNSRVGLGGGAGGPFGARGSRRPNPALDEGFAWLTSQQQEAGNWHGADPRDEVTTLTVTSVVLLAMLADGSTMRSGPHKEPIKSGIRWLRGRQQDSGAFGEDSLAGYATAHAVAALAMNEAFLLSKYGPLQKTARLGTTWLNRHEAASGTWTLEPTAEPDATLTLWAQFAGFTANYGKVIDSPVDRAGIRAWLDAQAPVAADRSLLAVDNVTDTEASLQAEAIAIAALTSVWAAAERDDIDAQLLETILAHDRTWQAGVNLHEWCCAAHVVRQLGSDMQLHEMLAPLAAARQTSGEHQGSFDPIDLCGAAGGRVWTTAMALLTLEAPRRYTRMFR